MLDTELVDDAGPGRRLVAQHPTPGQPRELGEDVRREAVRKHRKRPFEHNTHHLPMTGHRVLAGRGFSHPGARTQWRRRGLTDARNPGQSEGAQMRNAQRHLRGNVTERVAAFVSVESGVWQFANAHAVEHDDDGAGRSGRTGCH